MNVHQINYFMIDSVTIPSLRKDADHSGGTPDICERMGNKTNSEFGVVS